MAEWTKGIDVSFYQGDITWNKAAAQGVKFAFIRACQGTQFRDNQFARNWSGSKQVGILRGAYSFGDYRYKAAPQAEFLYKIVKESGDLGELPHVLDLEPLWQPLPASANTLAWVRDWFEAADSLFGRRGIFYTNPSTLRYWLGLKSVPDWLSSHPLWLAHYGISKPDPFPFKTWTFWQYSAKGDGIAHGMASKDLDMDWFAGGVGELLAFAGKKTSPPALSLEEKVERLWVAHPELHREWTM